MALAAGASAGGSPRPVEDLAIRAPLIAPDGETTLVQTILEPAEDGIFRLEIYSNIGTRDAWTLHASATLGAARSVQAGAEPLAVADIQARCTELLSAAEHYERLAQHGIAL